MPQLQSGDHVTVGGKTAQVVVVSEVGGYVLVRYDEQPGVHRVSPSAVKQTDE